MVFESMWNFQLRKYDEISRLSLPLSLSLSIIKGLGATTTSRPSLILHFFLPLLHFLILCSPFLPYLLFSTTRYDVYGSYGYRSSIFQAKFRVFLSFTLMFQAILLPTLFYLFIFPLFLFSFFFFLFFVPSHQFISLYYCSTLLFPCSLQFFPPGFCVVVLILPSKF